MRYISLDFLLSSSIPLSFQRLLYVRCWPLVEMRIQQCYAELSSRSVEFHFAVLWTFLHSGVANAAKIILARTSGLSEKAVAAARSTILLHFCSSKSDTAFVTAKNFQYMLADKIVRAIKIIINFTILFLVFILATVCIVAIISFPKHLLAAVGRTRPIE